MLIPYVQRVAKGHSAAESVREARAQVRASARKCEWTARQMVTRGRCAILWETARVTSQANDGYFVVLHSR